MQKIKKKSIFASYLNRKKYNKFMYQGDVNNLTLIRGYFDVNYLIPLSCPSLQSHKAVFAHL